MSKVLIIGGSGLVGKHLCKLLSNKGYEIAILSRSNKNNTNYQSFTYNINKNYIDDKAFENTGIIVNLAGASIADKRWTKKQKQLILDSRIKTTNFIFNKIKEKQIALNAYISASAIGYYGAINSNKIFSEDDLPATDFIGEVCNQWEKSADQFTELGIRTVKIRVGIVLSKHGGALSKILPPTKMGLGSALGNGTQYMPWIHIDDLCNIFTKAIEDQQMNGSYNAVAPDHQSNKEFSRTLAHVLEKPFFFPSIPAFILRLFFGEMSNIILKGSRISSKKISSQNFTFLFPTLKNALIDLFQKDNITA